MTQAKQEETIDSLGAPWPQRYEREMREVARDENLNPGEKSHRIVEKADELGLQPFDAPDPLPVIREEEIMLVWWMAVAPIPDDEDEEESGPTFLSNKNF